LNVSNKNVVISHHLPPQNSDTVSTHFWKRRSIENNFTNFSAINPKLGLGPTGLFVEADSPTDFVPLRVVSFQHFGAWQFFKLEVASVRLNTVILVENRMSFSDVQT
jgi:hypothetical protein